MKAEEEAGRAGQNPPISWFLLGTLANKELLNIFKSHGLEWLRKASEVLPPLLRYSYFSVMKHDK